MNLPEEWLSPEASLAERAEAASLLEAEVLAPHPLQAELARHEHLVLAGARLLQLGLRREAFNLTLICSKHA